MHDLPLSPLSLAASELLSPHRHNAGEGSGHSIAFGLAFNRDQNIFIVNMNDVEVDREYGNRHHAC